MFKAPRVILFASVFLLGTAVSHAEDVEPDPDRHPEWVKRAEYSMQWETDQTPIIYFETIHPIYQDPSKTNTYFIQPRISIQRLRGIYNFGIGYRRLLLDDNLLAGINTFYDNEYRHRHERVGVGVEAIGKRAEIRFNSYFGVSRTYIVQESPADTLFEKAVDGVDFEVGTPIPFLPFAKIFHRGFWYDFKKSTKNMQGDQWRLELKPSKHLTVDMETFNDNKGEREYRGRVAVKFFFHSFSPRALLADLRAKKAPYRDVDLGERTLDFVERSMTIQVEKWKDVGGVSVEVGRT